MSDLERELFGVPNDPSKQHTGINFEKYDDIPVEASGQGVPELKYALGKSVEEIRAGARVPAKLSLTKKVSARKAKKRAERAKRFSKQAAFKKRKSR